MSQADLTAQREAGLQAVEALCAGAKWRTERVDCAGEIELVAELLPSGTEFSQRVWLQVTTKRDLTQFRKRDGLHVLPASLPALKRVFSRREPTIAVLWSLDRGRGFWTMPALFIQEHLVRSGEKANLPFNDALPLDATAMPVLEAAARLWDFEQMVSLALDQAHGLDLDAMGDDHARESVVMSAMGPAIAALRCVGLLVDETPTAAAIDAFIHERDQLAEDEIWDEDPEERDNQALRDVIEAAFDTATTGLYIPRQLTMQGELLLRMALEEAHVITPDADEAEK